MTSRAARRIIQVLPLALALALGAAPLAAQSAPSKKEADKKARQLYLDGDKAYAEGRYEQALDAFQQAYELSSRPGLLYNIGNALERLGRHREAAETLGEYLPHAKAAEKDVIQKRVDNLKKRAEEDREREERKRREAEDRDEVEREREQDRDPEPTKAPPPAGEAKESPTLGYVLVGVGGAAIIGGAIAGALALGARSDADSGCSESGGKRLCTAEARDAIDRDKTLSLLADVGLGVGIIATGIGVYLIIDSGGEQKERVSRLRIGPRQAGGELRFETTF